MTIKTDLDHLPEKQQHELTFIRNTLLNGVDMVVKRSIVRKIHFKVIHIILFGYYASNRYLNDTASHHISDYDILVVVSEPAMEEDHILWRWVDEKIGRRVKSPVNIYVHSAAYIDMCLQEGNEFFGDIRREGIYLFSHNIKSAGLPAPKYLTTEEKRSIAEGHFKFWFERANNWYAVFNLAFEKGYLREAAFLLHQATECYFATYLLVVSNHRPRTHNIKQLRSMTLQRDHRMAAIFSQKTPFDRRSFKRLNRAFIGSLYCEHYTIDRDELSGLAEQVELLKEATKRGCGAYIDSLVELGSVR